MSLAKCKGVTKSGERCKRNATSSGFCYTHDPDAIAEHEAQKQSIQIQSAFKITDRRFSERLGLKPVSEILQVDKVNQDLRTSLWNILIRSFLLKYSSSIMRPTTLRYNGKYIDEFIEYLWLYFFKKPLDDLPTINEGLVKELRGYFEKFQWYEIYDFLEVTINYFECKILVKEVNDVLSRELSGFRFIGGVFTNITTEQEVKMLEEEVTDKLFPAVSSHLKRALALMSDRENPDYRNSIKESISAVESLAKIIAEAPKATLKDALQVLERSKRIHTALKDSFLKLYGYTSDEGGIRHAMLVEPDLTSEDAKFFLLSCTSFINYLKSKISADNET
ncbi:DUF5763 domain-containing protein [Kamptonema animale CS-326]|jgi:hypothetical protein|uniref:AbiJ-NTD4 domain-containing protein n=1 Tax=Kamptonema animale TaxID=92934 RepID=UPI00232BFC58|nr:DUF5763 domain-containing protein [Kamptonema animale]MDB9513560.1 DUF5763 domain-containing protein [Kamptonema animale CS-326]